MGKLLSCQLFFIITSAARADRDRPLRRADIGVGADRAKPQEFIVQQQVLFLLPPAEKPETKDTTDDCQDKVRDCRGEIKVNHFLSTGRS